MKLQLYLYFIDGYDMEDSGCFFFSMLCQTISAKIVVIKLITFCGAEVNNITRDHAG